MEELLEGEGVVCSAVWRVGWQWAGMGGGETESQGWSVTPFTQLLRGRPGQVQTGSWDVALQSHKRGRGSPLLFQGLTILRRQVF